MTRSDMQLLSVNVARSRLIVHHGNRYTTGIFKQPVIGRVMLRRINLQGDQQADRSVHGGPDKAVYVYPFEHYAYWAEQLARDDFTYGQFGENFTAMGVTEDVMHIGDVLRIGGAVVQVTQVRVPCYKLANKLGIAGFERTFRQSLRVGYYLRVLEEGEVGAGDAIERVQIDPARLTVREAARARFGLPREA